MHRILMFAVVVTATSVWAQQPSSDGETATEVETEAIEGLSEEELRELDIDSQDDHTEEDEDVFKPTDVVSYTQPVPFPVDI